jgi:hypothetical protein
MLKYHFPIGIDAGGIIEVRAVSHVLWNDMVTSLSALLAG